MIVQSVPSLQNEQFSFLQTCDQRSTKTENVRENNQMSWRGRQLFKYSAGEYYDIGVMNFAGSFYQALSFGLEGLFNSPATKAKFSTCCNHGALCLPALGHSSDLLFSLLTKRASTARQFSENSQFDNSVLPMELITFNWTTKRYGAFTCKPTTTLHGRMYHYIDVHMHPRSTRASSLSVWTRGADFISQTVLRMTSMPRLRAGLLRQLTAIIHDDNYYVQSFMSLKEQMFSTEVQCNCSTVFQDDRQSASIRLACIRV